MTRSRHALLGGNEEIMLRRVAHRQSNVALLRTQDLARLRTLSLVDGNPQAPTLEADGRRRDDSLPMAVALTAMDVENELMATISRLASRKTKR